MTFSGHSVGFCHRGASRPHNEDAILERPDYGLWMVADGMGGHQGGDVASRLACEKVDQLCRSNRPVSESALRQALEHAHRGIRQYSEEVLAGNTIGSTVVALMIQDASFQLLWAGDSRCYRLREGQIEQLSTDHTQVQAMVEEGMLSAREADSHPMAHMITRALGATEALQLDQLAGEVRPGDRFLLCSDGVSGEFSSDELRAFLSRGTSDESARAILHAALVNECSDNVSCIIVNALEGCYVSDSSEQADGDLTIPATRNTHG